MLTIVWNFSESYLLPGRGDIHSWPVFFLLNPHPRSTHILPNYFEANSRNHTILSQQFSSWISKMKNSYYCYHTKTIKRPNISQCHKISNHQASAVSPQRSQECLPLVLLTVVLSRGWNEVHTLRLAGVSPAPPRPSGASSALRAVLFCCSPGKFIFKET